VPFHPQQPELTGGAEVHDGSTIPLERIQVGPFPGSQSSPPRAPTSPAHPELSPPPGDANGNLRRVTSWRQRPLVLSSHGARRMGPAVSLPSQRGGKDRALALKPCEGQRQDLVREHTSAWLQIAQRFKAPVRCHMSGARSRQRAGNGPQCHVLCSCMVSDLRKQDLRLETGPALRGNPSSASHRGPQRDQTGPNQCHTSPAPLPCGASGHGTATPGPNRLGGSRTQAQMKGKELQLDPKLNFAIVFLIRPTFL